MTTPLAILILVPASEAVAEAGLTAASMTGLPETIALIPALSPEDGTRVPAGNRISLGIRAIQLSKPSHCRNGGRKAAP